MSKEMIVRLNADRVKLKNCEYVQDLIRCGECKKWTRSGGWTTGECDKWGDITDGTDFCSCAVRKENE